MFTFVNMHKSYTKLFNTIVLSTIWGEKDHIRIVWITMLALADRFGEVSASVPGLAAVAHVSEPDVIDALKKLSSPDPHSRSKEKQGRRIEAIDGGWQIINHGKYRRMLDEEDRREYRARWMRDKRAREQK